MRGVAAPLALAVLGMASLVHCSLATQPQVDVSGGEPATSVAVGVRRGAYFGLAWLPGDWIVSRYESVRAVPQHTWHIWRFRPDGSEMERFPLPEDAACARTRYDRPSRLPDGRLGVRKWCVLPPGGGAETDAIYLAAIDPQTGVLAPLVQGAIARLAISQATWHPSMERGMVGSSSQICASIAWLTPRGVETPNIPVSDGRRSWDLGDYFRRSPAQDCASEGRADYPSWSPDGSEIAFFASPQSMGVSGQRRLEAPWNLYVMDPVARVPRAVLRSIGEPRALEWSPAGGWLAFSGRVTGRGKGTGVWLFSPSKGSLRRAATEDAYALAWSPDGARIIVAVDRGSEWPPDSALLRFEVGALLK